ncbi:MAG: methionyl-tRNA formyltransferase [Rickettsia sp.]|nr:methionyl-tRNA formyltransferase [Rickettsia sp.]
MRVIFMGSGEFAYPPFLSLIHSSKHDVVAVFTKMPQKKGRGLKLHKNVIHEKSLDNGIDTYTPNILDTETINLIKKIDADLIIVVSYDKKIPSEILFDKKLGALNIHPSLLPKYRGASPIQHTILNKDLETGVCIIKMDEKFDTGDIVISKKLSIDHDWDYLNLSRKLSIIGSNLLLQLLIDFHDKNPIPQSRNNISYAHKFYAKDFYINLKSEHITDIDAKVRALKPYLSLSLEFQDKKFQVKQYQMRLSNNHHYEIGKVIIDYSFGKKLLLPCIGGILELEVIKPENSRTLLVKDFINGLQSKKNAFCIS